MLATVLLALSLRAPAPRMAEATDSAKVVDAVKDAAFGASHTSMYTDAIAKDSYDTLEDILSTKMADPELRSVLKTMFDGCGTITEALRNEIEAVGVKKSEEDGEEAKAGEQPPSPPKSPSKGTDGKELAEQPGSPELSDDLRSGIKTVQSP